MGIGIESNTNFGRPVLKWVFKLGKGRICSKESREHVTESLLSKRQPTLKDVPILIAASFHLIVPPRYHQHLGPLQLCTMKFARIARDSAWHDARLALYHSALRMMCMYSIPQSTAVGKEHLLRALGSCY